MNHLPLKKYLEHHGLSMEDLEARKNILEPMKKIIGVCMNFFREINFISHSIFVKFILRQKHDHVY